MNLDFETYSQAGTYFNLETKKWSTANLETDGVKKGLGLVGAYVYAEHPSTEVLVARFSNDRGLTIGYWTPEMPPPLELTEHVRKGGLITAWNSFFEWCIWNLVCVRKYGWPSLPVEQTRDSMAAGLAWSLPGSLDKASQVIHGISEKDGKGHNVMIKLSQPRNPTKLDKRLRYRRSDVLETDQWEHLDSYCKQDVIAEINIANSIPELTSRELVVWVLDQKINSRGIKIDLPLVESCLRIMMECRVRYGLELSQLTGGRITAVSQATEILKWVNELTGGKKLKTLEVDVPEGLQEYLDSNIGSLPANVVKVLEIRRDVGGSAPTKLAAMKYQTARDGRARGVYQYCGAQRTKRWAGRGIQTQNMPTGGLDLFKCETCGVLPHVQTSSTGTKSCPVCGGNANPLEWGIETIEAVLPDLYSGNFDFVSNRWGNPAKAVSGCLRSMLIPEEGYEFISSDYSAIEAVVLAAMAGEWWVIDVFLGDGKLYERTGSKISGVPMEEIMAHKEQTGAHHSARKIGKVATLASGYQGARGAWLKFKAGEFLSNKDIDRGVKAWREASPNIVEYWYQTGDAALSATNNPEKMYPVLRVDGTYTGVSFQKLGRALYCYLPNGEWLTYLDPEIKPRRRLSSKGWKISELCDTIVGGDSTGVAHDELRLILEDTPGMYHLLENVNFEIKPGVRNALLEYFYEWKDTLTYMGVQKHNWVRIETYGGKLVENITQATARFILSDAMPRIEAAGYPIVMHTHDELVSEVPEGFGSIVEYEGIMSIMPPWAVLPDGTPWPVKASGGWRGKRFRK